jgi:hypothetical protein
VRHRDPQHGAWAGIRRYPHVALCK